MLESFHWLVQACSLRGYLRLSTLSSVNEGTRAWVISARDTGSPESIANVTHDTVSVYSVFPDFTPADAFFASMMVNSFDGNIVNTQMIAGCVNIPSVLSTRAAYNLNC